MNQIKKTYDVIIIGGGFYGCVIALFLKNYYKNILIIEGESDILLKASQNNQARIHNGYHYPRSLLTALRSHENYGHFINDFPSTVVKGNTMIYAIAKNNSKITSSQFQKFCQKIGSPLKQASEMITQLFDEEMIEDIFEVQEDVFDVSKLRGIIKKTLQQYNIQVLLNSVVSRVTSIKEELCILLTTGEKIISKQIFNCSYSQINTILGNSSLPTLPLKHEVTEMPLVQLPKQFSNIGITVMDGPFFSIMPFPSRGLHSIHHVRYTPHTTSFNHTKNTKVTRSHFIYMLKDIQRYLPNLPQLIYKDSIYETKTILTQTEYTDARPILFRENYGIKNFHVVLGGKIDNIYDILEELKKSQKH